MADSRFPEDVRELAREKAGFSYSFMDPNSPGTRLPTPSDMDRLGRLAFEISRYAIEEYGLTGNDQLEAYLEEIEEFAHLEFKKELAGMTKGMVSKDGEDDRLLAVKI